MSLCLGTLAWAFPVYAESIKSTDVIPLRKEAQALGWAVTYDDAARRVDLQKGDTQAAVWLDSRTGYRDAQPYTLTTPVQVNDDRAYISRYDLDHVLGEVTDSQAARELRQRLADDAANYLGVAYAWGGTDPSTGFDCSGFVWFLYRSHHLELERTSAAGMYTTGSPVDRSQLQPGDLVFFDVYESGAVSHVGVYVGDGQFISATDYGIARTALSKPYWAPKYVGARRM